MPADTVRATAVAAAAAAQCLIPTMGPLLLGTHEEVDDYDTVVTPPDYAFAVWAPIFAGTVAHAVQQALPGHRSAPVNRRSGWPLAAAYAADAAWSVAAQRDRFAWTPGLLLTSTTCAAVAFRRQQAHEATGAERLAATSTGLLLGWTSLASTINVLAASQLLGARPASRGSRTAAIAAALAVSGALGVTARRSRQGAVPLASTSTWGLATIALDGRRPRAVRATAALGALAVASGARSGRARP
jgi:hypothetical protein